MGFGKLHHEQANKSLPNDGESKQLSIFIWRIESMLKNIWLSYSLLKHRKFQISFEKMVDSLQISQCIYFEFRDENFKHLAGFHKLSLNNIKDSKKVPELIRTEKLNYRTICSSQKFETFLRRSTASQILGLSLRRRDSYVNIYEYSKPDWSKLDADFLLHFRTGAYDYYLFLKSLTKLDSKPGTIYNCKPVSFFRNEPKYSIQKRYELNQTRLAITSISENLGEITNHIF